MFKKIKKEKKIMLVLAAALIISVAYIINDNLAKQKQTELSNAYLLGVNDGRIQLLDNILSQIQSNGVARLTIASGDQTATLMLAPVTQSVQANTSTTTQ